MSETHALLKEIDASGLYLWLKGTEAHKLVMSGELARCTPDLQYSVQCHKEELILALVERGSLMEELEQGVRQAKVWKDLEEMLQRAQAAFAEGLVTREQIEELAQRTAARAQYIAMSLEETLSSISARQAQITLYSRKLKKKVNITDKPAWPPLRLSYTTDEVRALCAATVALDGELVGKEEEWPS
jgi:hypothetical protein